MKERTGAGDAFGSAFLAGYMEKEDIAHAIQLGTANSTGVLQEVGATRGLLKKDEWGSWEKVEGINILSGLLSTSLNICINSSSVPSLINDSSTGKPSLTAAKARKKIVTGIVRLRLKRKVR